MLLLATKRKTNSYHMKKKEEGKEKGWKELIPGCVSQRVTGCLSCKQIQIKIKTFSLTRTPDPEIKLFSLA